MFLAKILAAKQQEVKFIQDNRLPRQWEKRLADLPAARDFRNALHFRPAIVAEVKRASPSRGLLIDNFDPLRLARLYEKGGAAAISVVTDQPFFQGETAYLQQVREATALPVLRKDFLIHPCQLLESRVKGADAVLLIAAALTPDELKTMLRESRNLGLSALVEIHNEAELQTACQAGAEIIGINNRNLHTFKTDISVSVKLAPLIPGGILAVSESGISERADMELLSQAGIDVYLIGEALVTAADPEMKLRSLLGKGDAP